MTSLTSDPSALGPSKAISKTAVSTAGVNSDNEKSKFSPIGQELALTTHDGRLTIWDAQTQQIKNQYIPSKHLSAVCTCLAWMPLRNSSTPQKR